MEMTKVREAVLKVQSNLIDPRTLEDYMELSSVDAEAVKLYEAQKLILSCAEAVLDAKIPEKSGCTCGDDDCMSCNFDRGVDACAPLVVARDMEVRRLREALQKVGNCIGAPTMGYSPANENGELKQRICVACEIIQKAIGEG